MSDPMSERYRISDAELLALKDSSDKSQNNKFPHIDESSSLDESDFACFSEIRDVLSRHGKVERFGVTLLHKHFDMQPNEVLVESVSSASRSMTITPDVIDSSDINTIDTQWYLGSSVPLSVVKCRTKWHS
jgi:hypothetical protein